MLVLEIAAGIILGILGLVGLMRLAADITWWFELRRLERRVLKK